MDWRTSDEQARLESAVDGALDGGVANAWPVAGTECPAVAGIDPAGCRLDNALVVEIQMARSGRGRFGADLNVILSTHPSYPNARAYVLKLHRDARPGLGRVMGRIENVTTGEQFVFANADELLACLARDAARNKPIE